VGLVRVKKVARRYVCGVPPQPREYKPPPWVATSGHEDAVTPSCKVDIAHSPTPLHHFSFPSPSFCTGSQKLDLWVKRDDLCGLAFSGNKVRKLEFIIPELLKAGHDSVVTIGGIQSNHCRAVATACAMFGMESHLVLRLGKEFDSPSPSSVLLPGNILIDRLMGAKLHLVTHKEYAKHGWEKLLEIVGGKLKHKNPYLMPVGGSTATGCWGYIEAYHELCNDIQKIKTFSHFDDIFLPVGSGGTAAGIAIANYLCGSPTKIHAVRYSFWACVCCLSERVLIP